MLFGDLEFMIGRGTGSERKRVWKNTDKGGPLTALASRLARPTHSLPCNMSDGVSRYGLGPILSYGTNDQ